ncbi:uncharacterized protein YqcC (DUF446 family) [Pseudomonas duriflava]|uniref:Uncharacterized protein YqcC (DUF446 family) n=1 Tax=Pseudomonas duriflava TaxID=459528 RepID=A0A562Q2L2_9PSED|nr:YqcC family protein [Pseudomonas duriflava]TWI50894.1 uncharacterized protein YqcC (DUF446 family) [Pseudomonas duriflava]
MDSRLVALADQLLLIERELRVLGWWEHESPSPADLASQQPFCVDTLTFSQWLQWIFLPRMKVIIETDCGLPERSGIKPMAEVAYQSNLSTVTALLNALGEFDRLIEHR